MKITKKEQREFVKEKLATDKTWANHGLVKIFDFQTESEKLSQTTNTYNGVGFTGTDAKILTSIAEFLKKRKFLTTKQQVLVFKKMPKYWRQIIKISDQEKLQRVIAKTKMLKTLNSL